VRGPIVGLSLIVFGALVCGFTASRTIAQNPPGPRMSDGKPRPRNLAILIFDGVEIIDYTGPYEVFDYVRWNGPAFKIYTVAEKPGPIVTAGGMKVEPTYSFDNYPKPDILLVPGGNIRNTGGPFESASTIKWIQNNAKDAEIVFSVCNGAWLLGKAGLLDGLEATSTASGAWSGSFQKFVPNARIVANKRFVDAGKIVTTAGISSGIDGAFHVIEKLFGRGMAQDVALSVEYNWQPETNYVRAQLADMNFNATYRQLKGELQAVPMSAAGDTDRWESKLLLTADTTPSKLSQLVDSMLVSNQHWQRQQVKSENGKASSTWRFIGKTGERWKGVATVAAVAGEATKFIVTLNAYRIPSSKAKARLVRRRANG
jgi:putative intracellular protease/amidase